MSNRLLSFVYFTFFSCFFTANALAQLNPITIDSLSTAFTVVQLNDSIDAHNTVQYLIDLDDNKKPELKFIYIYAQGSGSKEIFITLEAGDSCTFAINQNGKGYTLAGADTTYRFPARIVRILNSGDKLYGDSCYFSSITDIFRIKKYAPGTYTSYVTEWLSGEHCIGIKKISKNKEYLGWVKIEVAGVLKVKEYAIETLPVHIKENEDQPVLIYPNPTDTRLTVKGMNCKKAELYDAFGNLVLSEEINSSSQPLFHIDMDNVLSGLYFLKLTGNSNGNMVVKKIIKQ
jgi:hypothetical protein